MSMIEGVGDEVLQFFAFVFVTFLAIIAWWSTGIRERPQIRTVLILEHRSPGISQGTSLQSTGTSQPDRRVPNYSESNLERVPAETEEENDGSQVTSQTEVKQEEHCPVKRDAIPDKIELNKTSSFIKNSELNKSESNTEDTSTQPNQNSSSENGEGNIRIRLKYLNDDQKLVEGRLQELLGEFKRRHFSVELSTDKLVRLIFNGQVLQCDDQTLQDYGLYDNCVVHCLVHAQRTNINRTNTQQSNPNPSECNLGLLLYTCLIIILAIAWYFRYTYSQNFTITTTAGLVGLTGIFAILVVGFYIPDPEPVPSQ